MAKKLYSEGLTGKVVIYDPSQPDAVTNPLANLDKVYFHSDLNYVGVAAVLEATVTHPARTRGGPATQHEYRQPNPVEGQVQSLTHNLGYVPHAIAFINDNMLPANTQIQHVGSSFRTVAIQLTTTNVAIYETSYVYQSDLPAINVHYRIVLFSPITPSGDKTLHITPERFIASKGKLDTEKNYIRRVATGTPNLWFSKGKTADVANGSFRIVTANGTTITRTPYSGAFAGEPGIGVEI